MTVQEMKLEAVDKFLDRNQRAVGNRFVTSVQMALAVSHLHEAMNDLSKPELAGKAVDNAINTIKEVVALRGICS